MAGLALGPANRTELRCGGAEAPLLPALTGTMLPDLASQAEPPAPAQPPLDGVCGAHWQKVPRQSCDLAGGFRPLHACQLRKARSTDRQPG